MTLARLVPLATLLVSAGCSITSKPASTRLYLLDDGSAEAASPDNTTTTPALGIGPVTLASYLDRPQLLRREDDSQLTILERDHWAEPLASQVIRVLHNRLEDILGPGTVVAYPWPRTGEPDVSIELRFDRLEPGSDGTVLLSATWGIKADSAVSWREVRITEAVSGSGPGPEVAAQSRALARLAGELAGALPR